MAEQPVPPWPAGYRIPRWARARTGQPATPDVYSTLQLDKLDRYHVGLYRTKGLVPHVVEITEHPHDSRPPTVRITRVLWPRDPLAVFEAAEAKYARLSRYFGNHRN
jgi:hypothetical protein